MAISLPNERFIHLEIGVWKLNREELKRPRAHVQSMDKGSAYPQHESPIAKGVILLLA